MIGKKSTGQRPDSKPADSSPLEENLEIRFRPDADGVTQVELLRSGVCVSGLSIVPFTIRLGAAKIRMDGVGGVFTEKKFQRRGYSRRAMLAAIERMRQGDGALSMLYGISNFYPKFGYATAGPEYFVILPNSGDQAPPPGWTWRRATAADRAPLRAIYDSVTRDSTGAAVRPAASSIWDRVGVSDDPAYEYRVIVSPAGRVEGCAGRAGWCWSVQAIEREEPNTLVIGEAMAVTPGAADAVLGVCQQWAHELGEGRLRPVKRTILPVPPDSLVSAAARYIEADVIAHYTPCGASMARTLHTGRLLQSLIPELQRRIVASGWRSCVTLAIHADSGAACLRVAPEEVSLRPTGQPPEPGCPVWVVNLPQTALARLALGAFPAGDILSRQPGAPSEALELMETLFPLRSPHMYYADRF